MMPILFWTKAYFEKPEIYILRKYYSVNSFDEDVRVVEYVVDGSMNYADFLAQDNESFDEFMTYLRKVGHVKDIR